MQIQCALSKHVYIIKAQALQERYQWRSARYFFPSFYLHILFNWN